MTQKLFAVLLIVLLAVVLTSGCIVYGEYPIVSSNLPRHLALGDETVCLNMTERAGVEFDSMAISTHPSQKWTSSTTTINEIRLNEAIVQNCTGW